MTSKRLDIVKAQNRKNLKKKKLNQKSILPKNHEKRKTTNQETAKVGENMFLKRKKVQMKVLTITEMCIRSRPLTNRKAPGGIMAIPTGIRKMSKKMNIEFKLNAGQPARDRIWINSVPLCVQIHETFVT